MKNRVISFTILAVVAISFSFLGSFIYKYVFEENKHVEEDKVIVELKNSLALSETQICRMKECHCDFYDNCKVIHEQFKNKKIDLVKELREDNLNTDNISNLIKEIDSLQSLLLHTTVNNILEQKNILDESQKDKFFSMLINRVSNEQKTKKIKHN